MAWRLAAEQHAVVSLASQNVTETVFNASDEAVHALKSVVSVPQTMRNTSHAMEYAVVSALNAALPPVFVTEQAGFITKHGDIMTMRVDNHTLRVDNVTMRVDNVTMRVDNVTLHVDNVTLHVDNKASEVLWIQ
jgi:hypothetical protein